MIFLTALFIRLGGVGLTTLSTVNPYSQADADLFSRTAARIADSFVSGSASELGVSSTIETWGTFLSPFWLLPGPSRVYGRIGMAVLGALAVYNVYVIAREYHSHRAGVLATLPLIVYPSFVFIHSTVLREAMVLFGLTTAARLLLVPSRRLPDAIRYVLVAIALTLAIIPRDDNLPIYLLVLAVGGVLAVKPWQRYPSLSRFGAVTGAVAVPIAVFVYGGRITSRLADIRRARARDRTKYLDWVFPETVPEAIAFSWIGAMYFLFTPFPWMVSQVSDFVVMVEAMGNLLYAIAAVLGARVLWQRSSVAAGALVVGIVVGSVFYGLGTANVGTAVRHRQMVLWAIFLLGGIGLAHHVDWGALTER